MDQKKQSLMELVEKAQAGDRQAIEDLLCQAHTSVSYQCRKMLANAQDAEDLTQEILLTVYTKLDTLREPGAFWGWLNRITATRCMNVLRRSHVDLQFAQDEEGNSVLDSLETLDDRQVPDKALDNAETVRMIDEIVSSLPEAQRMSTLLYYYDEMSVKEIAQIMSVPENTVKGRLNLARKAIKERVVDYEKQGVKLYSLSVLPFLWYFLRSAAQSEADAAAAAVCTAKVLEAGTANPPVEAAAAAKTAARTAGVLSKKVIGGILAGVLVVGCVAVAAIQLINHSGGPVPAFICQHQWSEANCTAPKTCSKCGSTEGLALGHEWMAADCVNPKTCSVCGETEGEPLGHTWTEATCETAKTCSVCGETEGEPLGHTWAEANYQQPMTCVVCGQTDGEALTPSFDAYGLNVIDAEMGVEYDYVTCCYDDNSLKTVGKLWFSDFNTFESDENHEAKEGFVWHSVTVHIRFDDDNAWVHGMSVVDFFESYYRISPWHSGDWGSEIDNGQYFSANYYGVEYSECITQINEYGFTGWENKTNTYICEYYWCVPAGYDGYIQGFMDASIKHEDGQCIYEFADENTLFFRFPDSEKDA